MAKKKHAPRLTYVELLVIAHTARCEQLYNWEEKARDATDIKKELIRDITAPIKAKLETIRTLYLIETGVDIGTDID